MTPVPRRFNAALLILLVAIIFGSCAPKNYLVVNYQLPIETVEPQEEAVSLVYKDVREDQVTLTRTAQKVLKKSPGYFFVLIVARDDKGGKPAGAYSLDSMIRQVFRQRLENAGIRVAPEEEYGGSTVEILLKEFQIDFVERKWVIKMAYQANFLKDNKMVAGETIKGSAERLRVVGDKDAEMIMGDLITDVANKLNLNELLKLH